MSNPVDKKELFETMPVSKAILTLAVPTVISQLINLIYNIVDTFFIGRVGNSYMMAAVTVSFTLFMMTIAFGNLFGAGGGSLIARLIGRNDPESAKAVSAFSMYGAITVSVTYSLLILIFEEPLLRVLGASDATIGFAKQYTGLVIIAGTTPIVLSQVIAHMLRNLGYAKQASLGLSGGGILNIILDPLLMFVLLPDGMQVFGAALATLISNVASCVFLLSLYCRVSRNAPCSPSPRTALRITREQRRELFSVGVPAAMLTALFDVANVVLNNLMAMHGDLQVAAIGIVMKIERLPNAINVGIGQGMMPIVAYNYSSGNKKRMLDTIRTSRLYGLCVSFFSLTLFQIFAAKLSGIFLSVSNGNVEESLATLAFAAVFLRIRSLASPVQYLTYHSSFCFQAMGYGKATLLHAFVRECVFYIPIMILMNRFFNENGIAAAFVIAEALGAVFALCLMRKKLTK